MRWLLALLWICLALPAWAQGTWSGALSLTATGMTHGFLNYQYLALNYTGTGVKSPLIIYEHENNEGTQCYTGGSCTVLANPIASGGAGPQDWYNNAGFQSRYCPNGCVIVMPYADQSSDTSGQTSNFGGYGDTPGTMNNEVAVAALIHLFLNTFNVDPNRVYVTGDSLGGIGSWAMGLDYGIKTGTVEHLVTAVMPFAGNIFRGGGGVTNSQTAQIQAGPFIFAINGTGDGTSSNPVNWTNPVWTAITGNSVFPGPPTGGVAGSSPYHYLLDTTLGHDVWDTYRPLPAGQPMLDLLFAQNAGAGGAGTKSPLPSGALHVVGNQTVDGIGNNVRMACSGYNEPTGNFMSDMVIMRGQGFNCARYPWYDAQTCPGGVCNFTTLDAIVTAALANSMKIIFDHHANEGADGANGCLSQQRNGLWYDLNGAAPWNVTNGTDGCGTAGTVTYARFKANWQAFANHFKGNTTVIGYDLDNEPTTYGNGVCCSGGGSGSGVFRVSGGQIIDPNGATFLARGINVYDSAAGSVSTSAAVTPLLTLFPKLNIVRFVVFSYQNASTYATFVNQLTAKGIVVEFENHQNFAGNSGGGQGNIFTGSTLTTESNWYAQMAAFYKGNPYVWFGTNNEPAYFTAGSPDLPGLSTWHQATYNAIRGAGANNIVLIDPAGGGNPGTMGTTCPAASQCMTASVYAAMTNVAWDMHYYGWIVNFNTDPTVVMNGLIGSVAAGQGVRGIQTLTSADGVMPVIIGETGPSTTGSTLDANGTQVVNADSLATGVNTSGYMVWNWQSGDCCNNLTNGGSPPVLTSLGTQVQGLINQGGGAVPPGAVTIGANWGSGNGGDMRAMVNDVGAAILTIDPAKLIIVEGIINNGNLFAGTVKGSANYPATLLPMDLSTVQTQPLSCCAGQVVYSVHDYPASISSSTPDSGPAKVTMNNLSWGFLVKNGFAPVWIGEMGASLDNTNGQQSAENAWATTMTQYMNGQLGGQGGPTFTGCQQPVSTDWWTFGALGGQNPDGTLNPDGSNRAGQAGFWSTLLYTTCSGGGGGVGATTWNPNDLGTGITLSSGNLVATMTGTGQTSVRSNTSQSAGKVCFEATINTVTNEWSLGLSNAIYPLTDHLGDDSNGIGFTPNSNAGPMSIYYNATQLSTGAGVAVNGDHETICADLSAGKFWGTTEAMRANSHPWNNDVIGNQNPVGGVGGISFTGLTCPCFITYSNKLTTGAVATLNAPGPFTVATPTGFSAWQAPIPVGAGKPIILIFGANDNHANDNAQLAFSQPMDLMQ